MKSRFSSGLCVGLVLGFSLACAGGAKNAGVGSHDPRVIAELQTIWYDNSKVKIGSLENGADAHVYDGFVLIDRHKEDEVDTIMPMEVVNMIDLVPGTYR